MEKRSRKNKGVYARRAKRRARIAAALRGGIDARQAAGVFGVSVNMAYRAGREHGLVFGGGGDVGLRAISFKRHAMIADAVRNGASMDEAARRFRSSRSVVSNACAEHNVVAPRKKQPSHLRVLQARAAVANRPMYRAKTRLRKVERLLLKTDLSYTEIGARCGLTRQRVQQIFREMQEMSAR